MKKIISLCLLLCLCCSVQAYFRFTHINSASGLPHLQVEGLAQDKNGNIWMGTRNGLSRYDGYQITTYYHRQGDPHSLRHNFIHALYVDKKDRLWVCTETGVSLYRKETDDFRNYGQPGGLTWAITENTRGQVFVGGVSLCRYDEKLDSFVTVPLLDNNFVNSLTADRRGNIYVSTNKSIFIYDEQLTNVRQLPPSLYSAFTLGFNVVIPLFVDSKDRLWIGRNGQGVMFVDLNTWQPTVITLPGMGIVRTIREDTNERIFVGTENGLAVINRDGSLDTAQHQLQNKNSLSDNSVYAILFDYNQNAWISTYYGGVNVMKVNTSQFAWQEPRLGQEGMEARIGRMIAETAPGVYWIATEDGGIQTYDTHQRKGERFRGIPDLGKNVYALYFDRKADEMWIGTRYNGLFRYNLKTKAYKQYLRTNGLDSEGITYLLRQRNGRLWVATMAGLRYYDEANDRFIPVEGQLQFFAFVHTLIEDKKGDIWAGTTNYGLFHIDSRTLKVTNYANDGHSGLTDNYVVCLHEDRYGTIWIGTNNSGLHFLNTHHLPLEGELEGVSTHHPTPITKIAKPQRLANLSICSMEEDGDGNLWISTTLGLYKYQRKNKSFVRFSKEDGLPVDQFNVTSSLRASNGRMVFGTVDGIVAFAPDRIQVSTGPFPVHMKQLFLNDQPVGINTQDSPLKHPLDDTPVLRLSHKQVMSFAIEYGVILPDNADNIEYQIWLEGFDKTWHNVGSERKFTGNHLPAGKYTLHVRASNSNVGWENCPEKTLTIVVLPPFYRTLWAYLFYVLVVAAISFIVWHYAKERMMVRADMQLTKLEKQNIEELDKAKSNFFTMVSHELKTPLSLIIAPLTNLRSSLVGEDLQSPTSDAGGLLDTALKNAHKMEDLIGQLVTFNKVQSGNFSFYLQKANPLPFLAQEVMLFSPVAIDKHIELTTNFEDNGEEVWFSPAYLERIVSNLLSNAIKFTNNNGKVHVAASITSDYISRSPLLAPRSSKIVPNTQRPSPLTSETAYLRVDVSDTGIGIAEEEQQHIFEHFYQTKRGYNSNNSGWGIGLALVKRLVDKHQGFITLDSKPDEGSTFSVWINVDAQSFPDSCRVTPENELVQIDQYQFNTPLTQHPSPNTHHPTPIIPRSSLPAPRSSITPNTHHPTLLIVDDNNDLLTFLADSFSTQYHVLTATNGREALQIVREKTVELIISDVMMPEMDGNELCRHVKENMETSHIPVILLTAKSESQDMVSGLKSGADVYVTKPFDPNYLQLQVKNILQLIKTRQTEIVQSNSEDIDDMPISPLDKKFITKMNELVDANIVNSDFSISDITRELGVSRTLLHTKMRSLFGMSMGDYIRKKRLDKACRLLREGRNVSETAYATGFSDPNWFSKTFKKHIGISPSEYMKNLK